MADGVLLHVHGGGEIGAPRAAVFPVFSRQGRQQADGHPGDGRTAAASLLQLLQLLHLLHLLLLGLVYVALLLEVVCVGLLQVGPGRHGQRAARLPRAATPPAVSAGELRCL